MIPYDDSIEDEDILAYWGEGYVLLPFDGGMVAYQVRRVGDGIVQLLRSDFNVGDAGPRLVKLQREAFFQQCVLHRPQLGVVVDEEANSLVHLSWKTARGDKIKSILNKDIHCHTLCKLDDDEPEEDTSFIHEAVVWGDRVLNYRDMLINGHNVAPPVATPDGAEHFKVAAIPVRFHGDPDHKVKRVLAFLNSESPSLKEAAEFADQRGASPLATGLWIKRVKVGEYEMYAVTHLLGVLHRTDAGFDFADSEGKEQTLGVIARLLLGEL